MNTQAKKPTLQTSEKKTKTDDKKILNKGNNCFNKH
jgi:hypothetical protein